METHAAGKHEMAWVDKAKETSAEHAAEREQAVKRGRGANGPITEAKRETPMSSRLQPPVQAHVSQFSRINGAPSHKSQAWRAHRAHPNTATALLNGNNRPFRGKRWLY